MRKFISSVLTISLFTALVHGQTLRQTVRGTIVDADSRLPLVGAGIVILDSDPWLGTTTDERGEFRFERIGIGRITLHLSYIGYGSKTLPDLEVNSGKELVLNLTMQESITKLGEVVIRAVKTKGDAVNDMSLISTRSISLEETKRYAGSYNDPARILTNFAGITNTQNGENDIIVRGNSPKYVQWRLEGTEITNPTHFADQNASKGGISALNNSLLATSDFSTGAFSPEYGDVLSGVYDIKLRAGNNEKFESSFGFGLLGTDFTIEGPFKKGYGGSFLVNFRYSTISLISKLGLINVEGTLDFQDAAFKVVLPTKRLGVFSLFGLGGLSGFSVEDAKPQIASTPNNGTNPAEITEDFDKDTYLANYGLNHTINLNKKSYFKTTLSYSSTGIDEDIFKVRTLKTYHPQTGALLDSTIDKKLNNRNRSAKETYRGAFTYNYKLNAKNNAQIGIKYALFQFNYNQSWLQSNEADRFTAVDFKENAGTIRSFISWKHRINNGLTMVGGFHTMHALLNHKNSIEPRLAFNWKLNGTSTLNLGYGKHSTMESIHNYFVKVIQSDGSTIEPNRNLDLLKAHHIVLGYEKRIGENIRAKTEIYYQHLYDLPVENNHSSHYATINEGTELKYVTLVNRGSGKNYGLELTVERFFDKNYYFLVNGSLYNSKYKSLEGVERNTVFNGNYLVNILFGKEFSNIGKKKNQTLTLNGKTFLSGGQKYIPLLRGADGKVSVEPVNNRFWDYSKAYDDKIEDLYQVTLSASYKWNRPKTTHEIFINLDNITNNESKLTEYYDETKPDKTGYTSQFGFFPNLLYRVYF